jgi:hypothetical protein
MKIEHILASAGVFLVVMVLLAMSPGPNSKDTSIYVIDKATSVFNSIPHVYTGVYANDQSYALSGMDRRLPLIINYKTTDKEAYPTLVKVVELMKKSGINKVRIFFENDAHIDVAVTDFITPNTLRNPGYNKGYTMVILK